MPAPSPDRIRYVDPQRGRDDGLGTASSPWRSLTHALANSQPPVTIQLLAGTYSLATGEQFPLQIPGGVTVIGDEVTWGEDVILTGGGSFNPTGFIAQNVTVVLQPGATVQGVTVTNAADNGTGIWIETGTATLAHSTLTRCGREGVFISGQAKPLIVDNRFLANRRSGISLVRHGKGEIRRNRFENTGYGLAIGEQGAPLLAENVMRRNRIGLLVWGEARPVLRRNQIEANAGEGLILVDTAIADLGQPHDPGYNRIRENGTVDLHNTTSQAIAAVGNDLLPGRLQGAVDLIAIAVGTPPPELPPEAPPPAAPDPPLPSEFRDLTGHWSAPFVTGLVQLGVVRGFLDGTFRPEVTMTRAQFATVLVTAFPTRPAGEPRSFWDVPPNFWAYRAIAQATAMGFLAGHPDGSFRPDWHLTRAEAIVALVNGLGWTGGSATGLTVYRDRAQIPSYATTAIATATQRRVVVNYPRFDQLHPLQSVSRGDMAALVYQALVAQGQAPVIASPYIVRPELTVPLFPDVMAHWAAEFIYGLANQGVMGGYPDGRFRPDTPMTRAQYAAVIVQALNPPPVRSPVQFSDVPADFWAVAAIMDTYRAGFLAGFPDRTFRPLQPIPRAQVWVSLVNGLNWGAGDPAVLSQFQDANLIPDFALGAIATATTRELVVNAPIISQLRPNAPATRAEVAAIVYQARVALRRSPPIASPYIVQTASPVSIPAIAQFDPTLVAPRLEAETNAAIATPDGTTPAETATAETAYVPDRPPLVMLDPGHGGQDSGAIGLDNLHEKAIVLDIAQQTAQYLRLQDIPVQLTRSQDETVELPDRAHLARTAGATLLLSIHSNAMSLNRPEVNGLETYHHPQSDVSAHLATYLHEAILATVPFRDRGVKAANFFILREVDMPAVLMELGFVTGAEDAPRLADPQFRDQLAQAIAIGIGQYLEANHPLTAPTEPE